MERSGKSSEFQALGDAVPDILFTTRPDGTWDYVNYRFTDLTGLPQTSGLGDGWVGALDAADARQAIARWREAVAQGQPFEMRIPVRRPNGECCWVLSRTQPVRDEEGAVVYWCGTWTEIDRLQRAEEAIRLREERFRAALKGSPVMVFGQDRALRYTWVHNPPAGLLPEAMLGKRDSEILERRKDATMLESFKRRVLENGIHLRREVVLSQDGADRIYDLSLDPERDNGSVVGITGAAVDITDQTRLERRLRKLAARLADEHRRKDEFLAMLGHELRNPLAPIRNTVNLVQASPRVDESELRRAVDMIGRQVSHLSKIADGLLDVGRVISGQMEFKKKPLSLAKVIRNAVETAESSIHDHGHRLHLRLPAQRLQVHGDRARLSQAVINLLQNAAKYTKKASVITLTLEREGKEALIKVRDTGIGIPNDLLPHVFDMFTQADRSLARSEGGLGLGLALVRTVAKAHRGRAEAYSSGLGEGSEFVIRLPLMRSNSSPVRTQSAAEMEGVELRVRRLLVVDDNMDVAESFAALLRALGHEATAVFSSAEALDAVEAFRPDVVFLDIGLPEMDGYEVARRIRERWRADSPLLVALSGYGQEEHVRRSRQAGFCRHLLKPPEITIVKTLLSSLGRY
jgi:PAS domain S-box-containing protein